MGLFGGGAVGGTIGTGIVFGLRDAFSRPADKIMAKFTQLEGVTDRATRNVTKGMQMMKAGFATAVAGAIIVAPLALAVNKSMEFNSVMSEVGAKANATKKELAGLKAQALELGEATKFTALEAGQGQVFLAQAGFKVADIMSSMPGLLSLASAGNMDLARTADIASNILTAMGLEATEMARVADVLALASTKANVDVMQLGEAFKFAAPSASKLGFTLEQTTAMIGLLGNVGIQGSLAGTAIQNFGAKIGQLNDKKLKSIGLSMSDITDSKGDLLNIETVMAKVLKGLQGTGNVEELGILNELFGLRGQKTVDALAKALKNTELNFEGFVKTLEGAKGSADRISNDMLNNLKGDFTKLSSVFESTMIRVGDVLEPVLRPVVQILTMIVSGFNQLAKTGVGKALIGFFAILGSGLLIGGLVVAMIGAMKVAFATLAPIIWTALAPVLPFVAAGMALVGMFALLKNSVDEFDQVMDGGGARADFMGRKMQQLGGIVRGLGEVWRSANDEGFTLSKEMEDALDRVGILDFVVTLGTFAVRIKTFFSGMWSVVGPVFSAFGDIMTKVWDIVDPFTSAIGDMNDGLDHAGGSMKFWNTLGKAFGLLLDVIIVPALNVLGFALTGVMIGIKLVVTAFSLLVDFFVTSWDVVGSMFDSLSGFLGFGEVKGEGTVTPVTGGGGGTTPADVGQSVAEIQATRAGQNRDTVTNNNVTERVVSPTFILGGREFKGVIDEENAFESKRN